MASLTLPSDYGYILAIALATVPLGIWHATKAVSARRAAGVAYPNSYVSHEQAEKDPKAKAFNCAQRAQANYLEHLIPFLTLLVISGLRYPTASAAMGGVWLSGRIWYTMGYMSSAGPTGRRNGYIVSGLASLGLMGTAGWTTYVAIMG